MGDHLSRPAVAGRLERCTRFLGGPRRRNLLHLAPDGVWRAVVSPRRWWALTPPFHPYRRRLRRVFRRRRSPFCATFRRLSPPGVSPASCPSVSGLSSDRLLEAGPRSPGLHGNCSRRPREPKEASRAGSRPWGGASAAPRPRSYADDAVESARASSASARSIRPFACCSSIAWPPNVACSSRVRMSPAIPSRSAARLPIAASSAW